MTAKEMFENLGFNYCEDNDLSVLCNAIVDKKFLKTKNFKVPERVSNFLVILTKLMINAIISLDLSRRNIYGKDDN